MNRSWRGAPGWVWACGLVSLALSLVVFPAVRRQLAAVSSGSDMLDLRFSYSAAQANTAVAGYGDAGRRLYSVSALTADLVFPLAYTGLLLYAAGRVFAPAGRGSAWLRGLPLAVMAADLLENVAIVGLLVGYPRPLPLAAGAAGVLTAAKWVLMAACLLSLAGGWFFRRTLASQTAH